MKANGRASELSNNRHFKYDAPARLLLNLLTCFVLEPKFLSGEWRIKEDALAGLKSIKRERDLIYGRMFSIFHHLNVCRNCHATCCAGQYDRFTVFDHISDLASGSDASRPWGFRIRPVGSYAWNRDDTGVCQYFVEGKGCRLAVIERPEICVSYVCGRMREAMTDEQRSEIARLTNMLRGIRWKYIRVLLMGGMEKGAQIPP
ncbi:MAG: hypothetical protein JXN60_06265 [Lentisphaerae bacterium]|nr:hypothetical protein [Lentisphaerota bacterium]